MLYKVLKDGKSFHGGDFEYSLPRQKPDGSWKPGQWHSITGEIIACQNGFHLTELPVKWWCEGADCFEAEFTGESVIGDTKIAVRRCRLVRKLTAEELAGVNVFTSGDHAVTTGDAIASDSATVNAYGSATVNASGSATVNASGSATVNASGSATVTASGSATVTARDSATVTAYDSATVNASGSAKVTACDSATVTASGSAKVTASGSATVTARDSATVNASGSAKVTACDSAKVTASGSAKVTASGSAKVTAFGSAKVTAFGSATVTASGSAKVTAFGSATVLTHYFNARPAVVLQDRAVWIDYRNSPAIVHGSVQLAPAIDGAE